MEAMPKGSRMIESYSEQLMCKCSKPRDFETKAKPNVFGCASDVNLCYRQNRWQLGLYLINILSQAGSSSIESSSEAHQESSATELCFEGQWLLSLLSS